MRTPYKLLTITNLIVSGLVISLAFNMPEIAVRFLIAGELPNDKTPLSPDTMLIIVSFGFLMTLAFLIAPSHAKKSFDKLVRSSSTQLRLPKRRFTSLQ